MTCVTSRVVAVALDNASILHQLLFSVLSNPTGILLDDDCSVSVCLLPYVNNERSVTSTYMNSCKTAVDSDA